MNRIDPLTGLRGVAAYSVLLAHGGDTFFSHQHSFNARLAYFGMSVFFVLSGFVIYYNYAQLFNENHWPRAARQFFVARFARLYPLYALSIVIAVVCSPAPHFLHNIPVMLSFATLTQSWFNFEMATFPPDWSISTEWFFYLAFIPLSYLLIGVRRPALALAMWCVISLIGLMLLFNFASQPIVSLIDRWSSPPPVGAGGMGWLIYFCPFVRLFEFVAGALAAKLYLTLGTRARMPLSARIVFVAALAWCVAAIFVAPVSENRAFGFLGPNFLFAPALAPILVLCCTYETPLSRMLSSRPALFAGEISYSVYIWSFAILTLISIGSSPAVGSLASLSNSGLRLAAVVFLTTALAYGSYLLVEMPSRRAIRAMLSGRPRVRQQARSLATSERTAVHPS